jgi:hypothetical protein
VIVVDDDAGAARYGVALVVVVVVDDDDGMNGSGACGLGDRERRGDDCGEPPYQRTTNERMYPNSTSNSATIRE